MSKRCRDEADALPDGKVTRPRLGAGPDEVAEAESSVEALRTLALRSPEFADMRASGFPMVDKTAAIADLLNYGGDDPHRVFFARPRKFGKSFTLSTAAEILAAGALPPTVEPWPGFTRVDVDSVFGGTEVHRRWLEAPEELRGLLQKAHFVVKLSLGGVQTGSDMKAGIISAIARIAGKAFAGAELAKEVRSEPTPEAALGALVAAVPKTVPVALLVDGED